MSHFSMIKQTDDPQLKQLYDELVAIGLEGTEENLPINCFTALGERPDILKGVSELTKSVVAGGLLPPTIKQMIAMVISMQNDCRYCIVAHTGALQAMGVSDEAIKSCAADPDLADIPPSQRAILQFALKALRTPLAIDEDDIKELKEQGLSDGEIIEVIITASWSQLLNLWTNVGRVPVDGEATQ